MRNVDRLNSDFYSHQEAQVYDALFARAAVGDVEFWCDLAEEFGNGPILELGCGTLRIGIGIARRGGEVLGVDRSEDMLAEARRKVARLPEPLSSRVQLTKGDIRTFSSTRRFGLACLPLNVVMELPSERDLIACLGTMRRCLLPRSFAAFEVGRLTSQDFRRDRRLYAVGSLVRYE